MAHEDGSHAAHKAVPAFDVVLRGYDRRQVDEHLAALEGRLAATAGQSNELRSQRDAAARRVHELEQRLNGAAGVNAASAPAASAQPQQPPSPAPVSLDGFGAKVEAILRLATDEAASIRRTAEESRRGQAETETRLRATFGKIAERLGPLAERLDGESKAARSALPEVTSQATAMEASARQQAQVITAAAASNAARMRADAQTRTEATARQQADVREQFALVKQILDNLGPQTTGGAAPDGQPVQQPRVDQSAGRSTGTLSPEAPTETIAVSPPGNPLSKGAGPAPARRASTSSQTPT